MKLETFFQKFDLFAKAPDAVTRMRELVLELAIQGKLVDQNPREGNAVDLVVSLDKRRRDLESKEGRKRIPKVSPLPQQGQGAQLPTGWTVVRLGGLCSLLTQGPNPKYRGAPCPSFRVLKTKDFYDHVIHYERTDAISEEVFKEHLESELVPGDIIYGLVGKGSTAKCNVFAPQNGMRFIITRATGLIRLAEPALVLPLYIKFFFASLTGKKISDKITDGSTGQVVIRTSELKEIVIPLPPLAEQKRIVAKVDELMALCDQLEAQQQERETRHAALARASLSRFADAPTVSNLKFLFHSSYSIPPSDLRKSILTLAVQGKLVLQDPNDEPAEELLARLEQERARIAKEQGVRPPKNVPPLTEDHHPHDIPESWQWIRIGQLALVIDYGTSQKADTDSSKVPVYRMGNIVGGRLVDENLKYVDASIDDLPGLYLKTDDILFNRTNSYELVGKAGIYKGPDDTSTFASYLIRIRLPSTLLFPAFYSVAMNAPYYRQTQIEPEVVQQCGQANFNGTKLASTVVPVPPLAEQRRIVAKVEQLMALVDALEQQLAASRATAEKLLTALVAELTAARTATSDKAPLLAAEAPGTYDVSPQPINLRSSPEFIRAVFAAEVIHRLRQDSTFGQTKFQKVIYLAEYLAEVSEIASQPKRFARGPHDPQLIEDAVTKLRALEWFAECPRSDGPGHHYEPLTRAGDHTTAFEKQWPKKAKTIRRIIDLMKTWKTERCERFATVYAAWNDLLIWGQPATDDAILREVLHHWHSDKQKISKSLWLETIVWMKAENFVPTGWGRATQQKPQAELF